MAEVALVVKIGAIEIHRDGSASIAPESWDVGLIKAPAEWVRDRFRGGEGNLGYYVAYTNGERSWSLSPSWENYEHLRQMLMDLPRTWYPDLLRALVEAAYAKKVFVRGGAGMFVESAERVLGFARAESQEGDSS